MDKPNCVLKSQPEPAANETAWAFDVVNVPRPSDGRGWRAVTGEGCHWPDDRGHPLRLERCPSLAGAGAALRPSDGRRWHSRMRVKTGPDEGHREYSSFCGEDRGEVSNPGHKKTAARCGNEFGASRLTTAEFALPRGRECCACLRRPRSRVLPRGETKTAAGRRRMAHAPQTCTRLASFATLPAHAVQLR